MLFAQRMMQFGASVGPAPSTADHFGSHTEIATSSVMLFCSVVKFGPLALNRYRLPMTLPGHALQVDDC
jgi:hypothetical protein